MKKLVTLGPPGSGKTTWIMKTMEGLIDARVFPQEICIVTFTSVAVREIKGRLKSKFPQYQYSDFPYVGTLHSLCRGLLGQPVDLLFAGKWVGLFSKSFHYEFGSSFIEEAEEDIEIKEQMLVTAADYFEHFDSWRRNALLDFESGWNRFFSEHSMGMMPQGFSKATLQLYCKRKSEFMADNHLVDFTGLLEKVIERGLPLPIQFLLCDEAQDNSLLLWRVIALWGQRCEQVVAVADIDQAVYSFLPADPQHFLDFAQGADRLDLQNSYRLPRAVQRLSESWISKNKQRLERAFYPRDAEGLVMKGMLVEELPFDTWSRANGGSQWSCFLLSRTRRQSVEYKQWLMDRGIPFATNRGAQNPLQSGKGSLIYALIKVFREDSTIDLQDLSGVSKWISSKPWLHHGYKKKLEDRIKAEPQSQIKWSDFQVLGFTTEFFEAMWNSWDDQSIGGLLDPLRFSDIEKSYLRRVHDRFGAKAFLNPPKILVTNIHGVKGMEADHVVLDPNLTAYPFNALLKTPEEERRVCYVGLTRAREGLYLLRPNRDTYYRL